MYIGMRNVRMHDNQRGRNQKETSKRKDGCIEKRVGERSKDCHSGGKRKKKEKEKENYDKSKKAVLSTMQEIDNFIIFVEKEMKRKMMMMMTLMKELEMENDG